MAQEKCYDAVGSINKIEPISRSSRDFREIEVGQWLSRYDVPPNFKPNFAQSNFETLTDKIRSFFTASRSDFLHPSLSEFDPKEKGTRIP